MIHLGQPQDTWIFLNYLGQPWNTLDNNKLLGTAMKDETSRSVLRYFGKLWNT